MRELGTPGSVGAAGGQPPAATRPIARRRPSRRGRSRCCARSGPSSTALQRRIDRIGTCSSTVSARSASPPHRPRVPAISSPTTARYPRSRRCRRWTRPCFSSRKSEWRQCPATTSTPPATTGIGTSGSRSADRSRRSRRGAIGCAQGSERVLGTSPCASAEVVEQHVDAKGRPAIRPTKTRAESIGSGSIRSSQVAEYSAETDLLYVRSTLRLQLPSEWNSDHSWSALGPPYASTAAARVVPSRPASTLTARLDANHGV